MTVSPSIPATIEMRRSRLIGLVATVAIAVAAVTWAATATTDSQTASPSVQPSLVTQAESYGRGLTEIGAIGTSAGSFEGSSYANRIAKLSRLQQAAAFGGPGAVLDALGLSAKEKQYVQGITSMSLVQQAAAFGGHGGVLDALGLTAKEKLYVQGVISLTPAQLAAGFGTGR